MIKQNALNLGRIGLVLFSLFFFISFSSATTIGSNNISGVVIQYPSSSAGASFNNNTYGANETDPIYNAQKPSYLPYWINWTLISNNLYAGIQWGYNQTDGTGTTILGTLKSIIFQNSTGVVGDNQTFFYDGKRLGLNTGGINTTTTFKGRNQFNLTTPVNYTNTANVVWCQNIGSCNFSNYVGVGDIVCITGGSGTQCSQQTTADTSAYVIGVTDDNIKIINNALPAGTGLTLTIKPAILVTACQNSFTSSGLGLPYPYCGMLIDYDGRQWLAGVTQLQNGGVLQWTAGNNGIIRADNMKLQTTGGSDHFRCQDDGATRTCWFYPAQVNEPTYLKLGWDSAGATPYPAWVTTGTNGGQNNGGTATLRIGSTGGRGTCGVSNGISPSFNCNTVFVVGKNTSAGTGLQSIIDAEWIDTMQVHYFNTTLNGTASGTSHNIIGFNNITANQFIASNSSGSYLGITNSTGFWMCKDASCTTTCQVQINSGLIIECI